MRHCSKRNKSKPWFNSFRANLVKRWKHSDKETFKLEMRMSAEIFAALYMCNFNDK